MLNYRDSYYGSILDPLHGDIKLSEIEKWCISQPIFARLRYVKQNTFLYYVFPSANHTRFEHSIGVMHIAGKIFDACKENFATGFKKKNKYSESADSKFFNLEYLGSKEPLYYQELRLAALLHDIGHGPMSHLFDDFSISAKSFRIIINADPILIKYVPGFESLLGEGTKVEHEILSCAFIIKLIHELKETSKSDTHKFSKSTHELIKQLSTDRIIQMIEPEFKGLVELLTDKDDHNYKDFFSRIVTAFPIDADRMDYLLRDSYFSGVTYGIYDINRIYASFQATKTEAKVIQLAYRESGLDSMLRFIQSRAHLFNQVYFHKTNRAANTMLGYATKGKKGNTKLLDNCNTIGDLIDFYVQNSDEFFLRSTISPMIKSQQHDEQDVLKELLLRKLFKRVHQQKIVSQSKDKTVVKEGVEEVTARINAKLDLLKDRNIYATTDFYANEMFKDADKKSILLAIKEPPSKEYKIINDWRQAGPEFNLSDLLVFMVRVYIRRTFSSSDEYTKMRDSIMNLIKEELAELNALPQLK